MKIRIDARSQKPDTGREMPDARCQMRENARPPFPASRISNLASILCLLLFAATAHAQILYTKKGTVTFFSKAPIEDISALTEKAECALDAKAGKLSARVPMNTFQFERKLMQQHYNENYLETDKYPTAQLEATVTEMPDISRDGTYPVKLKGTLLLHGVKRNYDMDGTITAAAGKPLAATSEFKVTLADHQIKIPTLVIKKIAEVIDVKVSFALEPRTK